MILAMLDLPEALKALGPEERPKILGRDVHGLQEARE